MGTFTFVPVISRHYNMRLMMHLGRIEAISSTLEVEMTSQKCVGFSEKIHKKLRNVRCVSRAKDKLKYRSKWNCKFLGILVYVTHSRLEFRHSHYYSGELEKMNNFRLSIGLTAAVRYLSVEFDYHNQFAVTYQHLFVCTSQLSNRDGGSFLGKAIYFNVSLKKRNNTTHIFSISRKNSSLSTLDSVAHSGARWTFSQCFIFVWDERYPRVFI